jgi:hypothetical protein
MNREESCDTRHDILASKFVERNAPIVSRASAISKWLRPFCNYEEPPTGTEYRKNSHCNGGAHRKEEEGGCEAAAAARIRASREGQHSSH